MHRIDSASSNSRPTSSRDTSIKIFRRYIKEVADEHGSTRLDASGVISRECYDEWKESRSSEVRHVEQEKGFQRCLTAHLTKSDGRRPFQPEEEAAIIKVLRQKRQWPAFEGTSVKIGQKGFRAMGYNERFKSGPSFDSPREPSPGDRLTPRSSMASLPLKSPDQSMFEHDKSPKPASVISPEPALHPDKKWQDATTQETSRLLAEIWSRTEREPSMAPSSSTTTTFVRPPPPPRLAIPIPEPEPPSPLPETPRSPVPDDDEHARFF
jgi:hypothetical protein